MIERRGFITGLVSFVAAPAIVRADSLMPVRAMIEPYGIGPMMHAITQFEACDIFENIDWNAVMRAYRVAQIPESEWHT